MLALVARQNTLDADRRAEIARLEPGLLQDGRNRPFWEVAEPLPDRRGQHGVLVGSLAGSAFDDGAVTIQAEQQVWKRLGQRTQLGSGLQQLARAEAEC